MHYKYIVNGDMPLQDNSNTIRGGSLKYKDKTDTVGLNISFQACKHSIGNIINLLKFPS